MVNRETRRKQGKGKEARIWKYLWSDGAGEQIRRSAQR